MPTVRGQVVDTIGSAQPNLRAELWQDNSWYGLRRLASATTDASGNFAIATNLGLLGAGAVHVRLRNSAGRLLFKSARNTLAKNGPEWVVNVTLHPNELAGLRITNRDPAGNHPMFSLGSEVLFAVDNAVAWDEAVRAVRTPTRELNVQLHQINVGDCILRFTPDPDPNNPQPVSGVRFEEEVAGALDLGVTVRFLIRDVIGTGADSADTLEQFFQARAPGTEIVRRARVDGRAPMHAKMMIIDGEVAHFFGSPFGQEYWDLPAHRLEEPRRGFGVGAYVASAGSDIGTTAVAMHDVGVRLGGPVVADIRDTFFRHWSRPDETLPLSPPPAPVPQGVAMQIVRSVPGGLPHLPPEGEMGVLEAYQRMLAEATDYVYLENQYLTEPVIVEAILAALRRSSTLEIIAVINTDLDIPGYQSWQAQRVREISRELSPAQANRFAAFTVWSHEAATPRSRILKTYVHSKVAISDDRWATVGSANLDGASLTRGEWFRLFGEAFREDDENLRNTEVNVLVFNGVEGLPASTFPADLRKNLWSEHLGLPETALVSRPAAGWLALWKDRAEQKRQRLNTDPATPDPCRLLAYRPHPTPATHLKALGVDTRRLSVKEHARSFDFSTGRFVGRWD